MSHLVASWKAYEKFINAIATDWHVFIQSVSYQLAGVKRVGCWLWPEQSLSRHFPSVLDTVGWATGRASGLLQNLDVGLLVMMIWLELCTTYSSSCHHHLHHPLLQFWTPANPGSPGKWLLKRRKRVILQSPWVFITVTFNVFSLARKLFSPHTPGSPSMTNDWSLDYGMETKPLL